MSKRVIYYYERTLSSQVNDIEHIESQSLPRYGVVKVFFQRGVNINAALAETTAASQTVLKYLPQGMTPPFVLTFNASSVPVIQLALSSKSLSQAQIYDYGQNFIRPQLASIPGSAIPSPYGGKILQVQVDVDQDKLQAYGLSTKDVVDAIGRQNIVTPVGTEKVGDFEYVVDLNGSPNRLDELNDLPIRVVNGATVFVHDVAYAHFGAPPQINMVRVDGANAALMTILKNGSASTLDVINDVKALLPKIRETLPRSLKLVTTNDQSSFVFAAVNSVIFEGVVAAALTGLMILIFLSSWRSTLIITTSIPLAILASVAALSAIGETINVMTLGGLALAVGILVDDATVTIENINYHLEQGKDIESAIMDGARQIVIPATVSLLCILIVFVPMFQLGGVGGYLFRPMAEAVAFALIASYVLSRTLVNTMARFLLAHQAAHGHGAPLPRTRNPLALFQRGFERRFEAVRAFYRRLLATALAARGKFIAGFLLAVACSFALAPYLGQNFFPPVENTQIKLHVRAPTGTRIENTAIICDRVERAIRRIVPPDALEPMIDNIGLPVSGINQTYNNSGTVGPSDADILITIKPEYAAETDRYVKQMRETLPRSFPGTTFAFLPADIVSQILNFGLPSPIDVQIVGSHFAANHVYANELLRKISRVPGVADARIQQAFNNPTLGVEVDRMRAAQVGLSEGDIAKSLQESLSGSFKVAPTFWINPENGVAYPIVAQTPQYWLELGLLARKHSRVHAGRITNPRRFGDAEARSEPGSRHALCGSAGPRHLCDQQRAGSRLRLRRHPADFGRHGEGLAARVERGHARTDPDDDLRLSAAFRRHCARHRPHLHGHRRQLPIVARPLHHRERAARRVGRHRLDAVRDPHDAVGSGFDRGNHVHGRRDGEQHSRGQLRARAAGGGRRRGDRGVGRGLHPVPTGADDGAGDDHRHGADGVEHRA